MQSYILYWVVNWPCKALHTSLQAFSSYLNHAQLWITGVERPVGHSPRTEPLWLAGDSQCHLEGCTAFHWAQGGEAVLGERVYHCTCACSTSNRFLTWVDCPVWPSRDLHSLWHQTLWNWRTVSHQLCLMPSVWARTWASPPTLRSSSLSAWPAFLSSGGPLSTAHCIPCTRLDPGYICTSYAPVSYHWSTVHLGVCTLSQYNRVRNTWAHKHKEHLTAVCVVVHAVSNSTHMI